jgi:hypothetical protein
MGYPDADAATDSTDRAADRVLANDSQEQSVGWLKCWSARTTLQDRQLVAQNDDLEIL